MAVGLYAVAGTTWTETGLTWNNKPAAAATATATRTVTGTTGAWYEFDVTAYLKQQKAAGATAVAFALKATAATTPAAVFTSDEAGGKNGPALSVQRAGA